MKFSRLEKGLLTLLTILVGSTFVILIALYLTIVKGSCGAAKFLDFISLDNSGAAAHCFCDHVVHPGCFS